VAKKARLDDSTGAQPMEEDAAAQGHFTEGNVHDLMPLYYRCALASQRIRLPTAWAAVRWAPQRARQLTYGDLWS
jgi:hypothetical protein